VIREATNLKSALQRQLHEVVARERAEYRPSFAAAVGVQLHAQGVLPTVAKHVEQDRERLASGVFRVIRRLDGHVLLEIPSRATHRESALLEQ
jgi:hypothetical protein